MDFEDDIRQASKLIDFNFEPVDATKLSKSELAIELEKAKLINSDSYIKQQWDDLINEMLLKWGVAETMIFISTEFTFDDFKTETRLAVD
jgi:hypothetical protein